MKKFLPVKRIEIFKLTQLLLLKEKEDNKFDAENNHFNKVIIVFLSE